MGRERIVYLDVIRAIAAIAVVISHYNAIFQCLNPPMESCYVLGISIFNISLGSFGVTLFLIISGAALMYVYDEKLRIKEFYKKRFLSIYPMFWMAYFASFLYIYVYCEGWTNTLIPKENLYISILGMDGYLGDIVPTFYLVGEWFLGFIIIFYILFPILRLLVKKYPLILAVISLLIYCLLIRHYSMTIIPTKNILIRLPELLFGMFFIKYIKKSNIIMAIAGLGVLVANQVIKPQWSQDIQTTYVGIATFLVLVYLSHYVKSEKVLLVFKWVSKYSYAIFLTHHIIICIIMSKINLGAIVNIQSYIMFFGTCFVIAIASVLLYKANGFVVRQLEKLFHMIPYNKETK